MELHREAEEEGDPFHDRAGFSVDPDDFFRRLCPLMLSGAFYATDAHAHTTLSARAREEYMLH